jgi:transcription elongation factor Elf1
MIATTSQRRARAGARVRTLPRALRTLTRCLVCGFREVRTDEVLERGVLLLNECPRCDHRWTERPLAPAANSLRVAEAHEAA